MDNRHSFSVPHTIFLNGISASDLEVEDAPDLSKQTYTKRLPDLVWIFFLINESLLLEYELISFLFFFFFFSSHYIN